MGRAQWTGLACTTVLVMFGLGVGQVALAAPVGKAVAKAAAKKLSQGAAYQKLGKIHTFEKPQTLIRWTNRPRTDVARGIRGKKQDRLHVFAQYPHPGRKRSPQLAQQGLAIRHKVRATEKITVPVGTRYHVRPIRRGAQGAKEVIVHGPIPPRAVEVGGLH